MLTDEWWSLFQTIQVEISYPSKQRRGADEADHPVEDVVFVHLVDALDEQRQTNQSQHSEQERCRQYKRRLSKIKTCLNLKVSHLVKSSKI